MSKFIMVFVLLIYTARSQAQSKADLFDYVKARVEEYSVQQDTKLLLDGCVLKYYFRRTLIGNAPWTQEWWCPLSNIMDVLYLNQGGQIMITLKLRDDLILVTDIEDNGQKKVVTSYSSMSFIFYRNTLSEADAKKILQCIKKLAKGCGAKVIQL